MEKKKKNPIKKGAKKLENRMKEGIKKVEKMIEDETDVGEFM